MLEDGVYPAAVRRLLIEPFTFHPQLARSRIFEARDDSQERCFARSALAENGEELCLGNLQGNIAENRIAAKILGDAANIEKRRFCEGIGLCRRGGGRSGRGNHAWVVA